MHNQVRAACDVIYGPCVSHWPALSCRVSYPDNSDVTIIEVCRSYDQTTYPSDDLLHDVLYTLRLHMVLFVVMTSG